MSWPSPHPPSSSTASATPPGSTPCATASPPCAPPESEAQAFVERYPLGATVPVAYNPADPHDCVLDTRPHKIITGYIFTALCLIAGAGLEVYIVSLSRSP